MSDQPETNRNDGERQIASPFSTGGGGTVFEMKVQASLLAALLVRGHVPGIENAVARELHLQTEHRGYQTDDALVIATDVRGLSRRQLWSAKHQVKFTDSDSVFRDVLADAWLDFSNAELFNPELDVLILATGPIAATHKNLLTLLEFARAAVSGADFQARLARKGLISQTAREYLASVAGECTRTAGRDVSPDEIWKFLRCFHIVGFDFDQTASQDEARLKSLLGLAIRIGTGGTGEDLWNTIFKWVANRNPRAGSFTRESLPAEWQQATTTVAAHFESGVIHRLVEHSELLLKRVRSTLGPQLHLPRSDIVGELAAAFVQQSFTLVTGVAGVGKSSAALVALQQVLGGAPLFLFQATEFGRGHIDHAFADLRVTESLSRISSLFALHPRKFMLIESVERLLESAQRDAFFMLLSKLAEDETWRVVLTCRQHAAGQIQDAFLTPLGLDCRSLTVPLLNDAELDAILCQLPLLRIVATHPRTRELLRNPWFLDKACTVDWSKESTSEPLDQRRLRDLMWRQVIVREDVRTGGIHLQRDRCFREIAVRRARSLQSFVSITAGEKMAVQALVADELLVQEPATGAMAPAHDVLEDWALVRWVAAIFGSCGQESKRFFEALGHEFAIRRAYRQWLQETLACRDIGSIRAFVDAVIASCDVPPYWKDETIVSVLLSDDSPQFIAEHESALLANSKAQLKTVIHLLRIACKRPNPFWDLSEAVLGRVFGDTHLVPEGHAWSAIIRLIHRNFSYFKKDDLPLLLGLLDDWKASANWQNPLPDPAREVGLIALSFWSKLDDHYHWKEALERLASLILTVPQAVPNEFKVFLKTETESDARSHRGEILEKKLLASFECAAACRSHPGLVAAFAEKKWGLDQSPKRSPYDSGAVDMNEHFGLRTALRLDFLPASALQGPFWALLQKHPDVGIGLILKLSNVATERFVQDGLDARYDQGPIEIEMDFGDGVTCKQWANPRLWLLFREGMPGPYVLESALMALEKYLLDLAAAGHDLRDVTRKLILKSNSVAVTAVVASVATAHPHKVGDTALALLRTPEFFELDLQRYVHDPISNVLGDWGLNPLKKVYHNERVESGKLPHRRRNLEALACELQTGPLREQVWKIIDEFKAQLPPPDQQTEELKMWRLRFHRMDLRNFKVQERLESGRVLYTAGAPEPDVAEVVEKNAPALRANEEATSVVVWGMSVFEGRDLEKFDPKSWREMLEKAQRLAREHENQDALQILSHEGGPGYVAAICVRDHWKDLTLEEKRWCRDFLLSKVMADKDATNEFMRVQRFSMSSAVAAARVLPILLDEADEATTERVREAIVAAITHAVEEVRNYAAVSIGWYLWERDTALASACIAGLLDFAQLERRSYGLWRWQNFSSRGSLHDLVWTQIGSVRERIAARKPLAERRWYRFSVSESFSASVLPLVANIVSQQQARPLAQQIYTQIAESFAHSWKREHRRRHQEHRNYQAESALKTQFANFVVRCEPSVAAKLWAPFGKAIKDHAEEVAEVFEGLIVAEDTAHKGQAFWNLWEDTKEGLFSVPDWQQELKRERAGLAKLASALLLDGVSWKEDARDWKPLHGHENKIRDFISAGGNAPCVCRSLVRLLDGIGAFLLPGACLWLDEALRDGNPSEMIGNRNSLFSLSRILTPLVFSRTAVLRNNGALRDATLRILDAMVDQGSSAAFRMRDFLITPVAPTLCTASARSGSSARADMGESS